MLWAGVFPYHQDQRASYLAHELGRDPAFVLVRWEGGRHAMVCGSPVLHVPLVYLMPH